MIQRTVGGWCRGTVRRGHCPPFVQADRTIEGDALSLDRMLAQDTGSGADYVELTPLASGGMGEVTIVLRREGGFERVYARKVLREGIANDDDIRRMFLSEGTIAGLLRHPNVVSVLDVREDTGSGPFLIMEYVDGVSVAEILRELGGRGRRLPVGAVLDIAGHAALGLHAAHEAVTPGGERLTIVHRDVSPHNLLVGFDGVTRVTDFGVAKVLEHLSTTTDGLLKGKLGYMSPEQLRFRDLDLRSDLFGLGVVLFEMLANRRLYGHGEVPAPRRILEEPPPDIGEERSDLPPALEQLLFRLLAKEREHRPQTALEVAQTLEKVRGELDEEDEESLASLLEENFGPMRAARADRIARAVRARRAGSDLPPVDPSMDLMDSTLVQPPPALDGLAQSSTLLESQRRSRGVLWALGIATLVAAVFAWQPRTREATDPQQSDPLPEAPPLTTHIEIADDGTVSEAPSPPAEEGSAMTDESDTTAIAAPPEKASTAMRRSPRRMRASPRPRAARGSMVRASDRGEPRGPTMVDAPADDIWTAFP